MTRRTEWCIHYKGFQHDCCHAGVNYKELGGQYAAQTLPCVPSFRTDPRPTGSSLPPAVACEHFRLRTPEEVAAYEAESKKRTELVFSVMAAVMEDAKQKGFKKGNGGCGSITCPACEGTVRYSIAGYNGHCHGQCSTNGCASWMQ